MQLVRLWVCWCDYIVWFMACHVSSRITGVEVREVGFFFKISEHSRPQNQSMQLKLRLLQTEAPTTTCGGELLGDYFYDAWWTKS